MKTMQQHIFISFTALKVSVCDSAEPMLTKTPAGFWTAASSHFCCASKRGAGGGEKLFVGLCKATLSFDSLLVRKCGTLGIPHDAHHLNVKLDQWETQVGNKIT